MAISTTTTERPTAAAAVASDNLLRRLIVLSLSPSTASKVIVKHHGGQQHRQQIASSAAGGGGAFRCKTCGRAFPTFQALGGHRTSHKRPLVRAHGLDLLLGARPGKKGAAASDVHRCTTCGAVFPTGQALGGHMRRHRAAAAATFDFAVCVHGAESETAPRVVIGGGKGESVDDDDARSIRLFKFI